MGVLSRLQVAHSSLSERQFKKLVRELDHLITAAGEAASAEKARGYWAVGQRIVEERISEEVGYHNAILRDVARYRDLRPHAAAQRRVLSHVQKAAEGRPNVDALSAPVVHRR